MLLKLTDLYHDHYPPTVNMLRIVIWHSLLKKSLLRLSHLYIDNLFGDLSERQFVLLCKFVIRICNLFNLSRVIELSSCKSKSRAFNQVVPRSSSHSAADWKLIKDFCNLSDDQKIPKNIRTEFSMKFLKRLTKLMQLWFLN